MRSHSENTPTVHSASLQAKPHVRSVGIKTKLALVIACARDRLAALDDGTSRPYMYVVLVKS